MSTNDSNVISILRFPLIIGVICIHAQIGGNGGVYLQSLFGEELGRLAVPIFLMISGFLFYSEDKKFTKEDYFLKIRKRISTLLIPYLLWNLIAYICYAIRTDFNLIEFVKSFWIIDIPGRSGSSPIDGPLWYVRDLFIIMIISPIVYYVIKKGKFLALMALLLLWVSGLSVFANGIYISFVFFVLGGYFRVNNIGVKDIKYGNLVLGLYLIFILVIPLSNSLSCITQVRNVVMIMGIYSCFYICNKINITNTDSYKYLASATFFIYCCHDILLSYIKIFMRMKIDNNILYLSIILLDLVFSFILFVVTTKCFPKLSKYLTGNR